MDYRLQHYRAKLVKRYRQNSSPWPDGIDTMDDPWYKDGSDWPDEKVELWSSPGWLDDMLRGVFRVTPVTGVTGDVTLDVTQTPSKDDLRRKQVRERVARFRAEKAKRDAT